MPAKNLLRVSQKGAYLHIYNKGIENKSIFVDEEDYSVFLGYLRDYLSEPLDLESKKKTFTVKGKTYRGTPHQPKNYFNKVELIAYSLVSEHFHLVLHQSVEGGLESFLRSLCTRYSIYFNKKYHRQGALFDGPYKSAQIHDEKLLLHLVCYLHKLHEGKSHSSHDEYFGKKHTPWVQTQTLHSLYGDTVKDLKHAVNGFKKFAEKYAINQKEKDFLTNVIIEKEMPILERRVLAKDLTSPTILIPKAPSIKRNNRTWRIPEYLTLLFVFVVLVGLGLRNISANANDTIASLPVLLEPTTTPQTISDSEDTPLLETVSSIDDMQMGLESTAVLSASESGTAIAEDAISLIYSLMIVKEGSGDVPIFKEPVDSSEVITTAHDGESLIAMPIDAEWYEVRFSDESKGFIMSTYLNLQHATN